MTGPRYTEMQKQKKLEKSSENSCDPPTSLSVTKYPSTLTHTKCCSYLLIVPTNQQLSQNLKLCMVTLPLSYYVCSIPIMYISHISNTYGPFLKRWVPLTLQPSHLVPFTAIGCTTGTGTAGAGATCGGTGAAGAGAGAA